MLIDIINENAEEKLLALLEQANRQNVTWGALVFHCSRLGYVPGEEDLLLTVKPSLEDKPAAMYFFKNADVVITWKGPQKATTEDLCHRFYDRYVPGPSEKLHSYFDVQAQGEELRLLCKRSLGQRAAQAPAPPAAPQETAEASPPPSRPLMFSDTQIASFRAAAQKRKLRSKPEMLMVEDDPFSRRLLLGLLNQEYTASAAANAAEGIELYSLHAPDIVFLDIQLPDADGHTLAALIRALDPDAYMVMVTGNNYAQDVLRAKENGVKGFVAKPYNKQNIQSNVDAFMKGRR